MDNDGVIVDSVCKIEEIENSFNDDNNENETIIFKSENETVLNSEKLDEKRHKCDLCDYSVDSKTALRNHKRIHSDEKPFKCDECDFTSKWRVSLEQHKKLHFFTRVLYCDQSIRGVKQGRRATSDAHARRVAERAAR